MKRNVWHNKQLWAVVILSLSMLAAGCNKKIDMTAPYGKYEAEFIGVFDVKIQVIGYAESETQFTEASGVIYDKMQELNRLFDIYHDYEGVANLKTINDNAGMQPVKVDPQIIELLLFAKEAYVKTGGLTNVAMGAVLKPWHDYRTAGIASPEDAKLPPPEDLAEAAKHTDINDVMIDEANSTVYLADPQMSLDVGAVAKGYAAEKARNAAVSAGFEAGLVDAGGNVLAVGMPRDGVRTRWGIGIQDPEKSVDGVANILDTIYLTDKAVVSSGDYQRFYIVGGKAYNHIISPETLMPAGRYKAVTIVHESSAVADYLSTAVFIASYEEGLELAKAHGAEAIWIYPDGHIEATDGYRQISRMFSGYSAADE